MTHQLTRQLQFYDSTRATCTVRTGFDIDDPHILFDVPLNEAATAFLDLLEEYYQPEAAFQRYKQPTEADNPLFMFAQAINQTLELPPKIHEGAADIATENIYGHNPSAFSDWDDLALAWLGQYLSAYNQQLRHQSPDDLDQLRRSINALQQGEMIADDEIINIVKNELGDPR